MEFITGTAHIVFSQSRVYETVQRQSICLSVPAWVTLATFTDVARQAGEIDQLLVQCTACSGRMWVVPHCQHT